MKGLHIHPKVVQEIDVEEAEIRRFQISAMRRKAFKALDSATGLTESDPPWLWNLKINGKKALNEENIHQAFIQAAQSNPGTWQLPKAVKALESPLTDALIREQITKAEWLLLEFWLAKSGVPLIYSFCYYNDKALAKLLEFLLSQSEGQYSDKYVRKIWERLGLKKSRRLLFRDVKIVAGAAQPVPYKEVIQRPI
jgi:hypothetical protein